MVVMGRLAADHAAKRHIPVIGSAGLGGQGDCRRDLERAGDGNRLASGAGFGDDTLRAASQIGGDMLVEERLDEQQTGGVGAHSVVLSSPPAPSRRAT